MLHTRIARFDVMATVTLFRNLGLELNTVLGDLLVRDNGGCFLHFKMCMLRELKYVCFLFLILHELPFASCFCLFTPATELEVSFAVMVGA